MGNKCPLAVTFPKVAGQARTANTANPLEDKEFSRRSVSKRGLAVYMLQLRESRMSKDHQRPA
jgi:hypothetical protein